LPPPAPLLSTPPPRSALYTLSLHDALPICAQQRRFYRSPSRHSALPSRLTRNRVFSRPHHMNILPEIAADIPEMQEWRHYVHAQDRKSTRLNSSHVSISYAVFCLKKKKI